MTNRRDHIRGIFIEAVELPSDRRGAFLDKACQGDAGLRSEVERLIAADAETASFVFRSPPSAPPYLEEGCLLAGRFRVVRFIAAGGMGDVYEVDDQELHERLALKTIRPEVVGDGRTLARFKHEVQFAKRVSHPNVCRIHDLGTHRGAVADMVFLTMQLLRGETLAQRLRRDVQIPLSEALPLVVQMAEALGAAHNAGVIHRDFKPSNVMLTGAKAVVTDFGLARSASAGDDVSLTEPGNLVGTPAYMAPEQLTHAELTPATDIYALGLVMYEMLTGKKPFQGVTPLDSVLKRLTEAPPSPDRLVPGLDPRWGTVILRCLEREPTKRYQRTGDVIRALTPGAESATETLTGFIPRLISKRPLPWIVATIVLAAVAAFGWQTWMSGSRPPPPEVLRWYQEGINALRDGTYFKATKALARAVNIAPKFAMGHARLAEAWMELDYTDKAQEEMLRANPPGRPARLSATEQLFLEAVHLTLVRDFAGAVKKYQEILKDLPDSDLADGFVDLGRAWEKAEKPADAAHAYQEATRRSPQYAAPLLRLGALYARAQDYSKADQAFDQADSLYRSLSNMEGVAEVLYQRATANENSHPKEAADFAEQAAALAHNGGNTYQEITSLLRLSSIHAVSDPAGARQNASEALDLSRSHGLDNLTVRALIQMGNSAFLRGELDQAKQLFDQAADLARVHQNVRNEMRAEFSLISVLLQQGKVEEGLKHLEPTLIYFRDGGYKREMAQLLLLSSRAKRKQGDYSGALKAAEEQLQVAGQIGNRPMQALAEQSIGNIFAEQERFPDALPHFRTYLEVSEAIHSQAGVGYALSNIGDQLASLGRYREAEEALGKALAIAARPDGDASLTGMIHEEMAKMDLSRLRFAQAEAEARVALSDSKDMGIDGEAHSVLALSEAARGEKAAARREMEQAMQMAGRAEGNSQLSRALLTSALVRLEGILRLEAGQAQEVLDSALRAKQMFAAAGKADSEWRASLAAARAAKAVGDSAKSKELAAAASATLDDLSRQWPAEDYRTYRARPDIGRLAAQLAQLSK
jgi:eukaryotic-like serine/threonine-protein kinase